jgi:hypothetical protein
MNITKVLLKQYSNVGWTCGETYKSIVWHNTTIPKPTEEELNLVFYDVLVDEMREERNQLLKESDYTSLPDFPTSNKQEWLDYRQQLRDFPSVWTAGVPFPSKPIYFVTAAQ